jgi:hypothetical protein
MKRKTKPRKRGIGGLCRDIDEEEWFRSVRRGNSILGRRFLGILRDEGRGPVVTDPAATSIGMIDGNAEEEDGRKRIDTTI